MNEWKAEKNNDALESEVESEGKIDLSCSCECIPFFFCRCSSFVSKLLNKNQAINFKQSPPTICPDPRTRTNDKRRANKIIKRKDVVHVIRIVHSFGSVHCFLSRERERQREVARDGERIRVRRRLKEMEKKKKKTLYKNNGNNSNPIVKKS